MKRTTSLLLAFLMMITVFASVPLQAYAEDVPVVTVESIVAEEGDEVEVKLSISNNPGLISLGVTMTFDEALTLISVTNSELLGDDFMTDDGLSSPFTFFWEDGLANADYEGDGVLAVFAFSVESTPDDGFADITVEVTDAFNYDIEGYECSVVNGGVNVVEYYTVSYNANGGTGAPADQTKTRGVALVLSSTLPTRVYTVTYNANGGSVTPANKTVPVTFSGWNTAADGSGTDYSAGESYTANAPLALYAQWTNPAAGELAQPSRESYDFVGWYTALSDGTEVKADTALTGDVTVYAHWEETSSGLPGDVNNDGKINLKDAILIKRYFIGGYSLEVFIEENADVNDDGKINIKDAILIKRYFIGGYGVVLK